MGCGHLLGELVVRRLLAPPSAWLALLPPERPARLAAFLALAGAEMHSRGRAEERTALAALIRALEDKVGECGGADGSRGHASMSAPMRRACAAVLSLHRRGWPADELGAASSAPQTLAEVRRRAAAELDVILVERDAPPEKLRGLREGWVHWFVGRPVTHPEDGSLSTFDEQVGAFVPTSPRSGE